VLGIGGDVPAPHLQERVKNCLATFEHPPVDFIASARRPEGGAVDRRRLAVPSA
jgi:hypothetical protein